MNRDDCWYEFWVYMNLYLHIQKTRNTIQKHEIFLMARLVHYLKITKFEVVWFYFTPLVGVTNWVYTEWVSLWLNSIVFRTYLGVADREDREDHVICVYQWFAVISAAVQMHIEFKQILDLQRVDLGALWKINL